MDLFLRKVIHSQARDNYRVILKDDGGLEVEVGSIGIQHGSGGSVFWAWAIDTVLPMRDITARGRGNGRDDCMKQFRPNFLLAKTVSH
jgi:hypothetical protein